MLDEDGEMTFAAPGFMQAYVKPPTTTDAILVAWRHFT
jgi:hypothetical protein